MGTKHYYCLFCGEEIFPEASSKINYPSKDTDIYVFQCDNELCQAHYESIGKVIPEIDVLHRPTVQELNFDGD
jgi:hypothetical protein